MRADLWKSGSFVRKCFNNFRVYCIKNPPKVNNQVHCASQRTCGVLFCSTGHLLLKLFVRFDFAHRLIVILYRKNHGKDPAVFGLFCGFGAFGV